MPSSRYERAARSAGYRTIAGLDEAGRGALFGPVFAAAVVLDPTRQIRGLDDSKELEPDRREVLAERIRERSLAWAVGAADAFEIDRVNILEASRLAMQRALDRLQVVCDYLLLDAIRIASPLPQKPLIHGVDGELYAVGRLLLALAYGIPERVPPWATRERGRPQRRPR